MAAQQKVTIKLPEWVRPEDREAIAEDIVAFIRDRTETGVGVARRGNGWVARDFPDYTEDYAKFKGVSRSAVDLRLSDEMLDALDVLSTSKAGVTIGYRPGKINGKVEGNRLGSYGGDPNPRKARDFLGITKGDLELILAAYEPEE